MPTLLLLLLFIVVMFWVVCSGYGGLLLLCGEGLLMLCGEGLKDELGWGWGKGEKVEVEYIESEIEKQESWGMKFCSHSRLGKILHPLIRVPRKFFSVV
jgi:hypothetical protein